jgi:hypothetical protein
MGRQQGKEKFSKNPLDLMREQMDELMGKNRDVALTERSASDDTNFADPSLDKFYLCGCSPYDLLKGTKSETLPQLERDGFLKERSEGMRMRWEVLPQEEKDRYGFERDLYDLLVALVEEHDRRIARLRERYDRENQVEVEVDPALKEQIETHREQIEELQTQSEVLGEEGDIEGALQALNKSTGLMVRLQEFERRASSRDQKKQYVDEVSGLVYSSTDNEARIADLQAGRQYKAWKAIRERLLEMRANPPPPRAGGGGGGRGDERERERERDYDRRDHRDIGDRRREYGRDRRDYGGGDRVRDGGYYRRDRDYDDREYGRRYR